MFRDWPAERACDSSGLPKNFNENHLKEFTRRVHSDFPAKQMPTIDPELPAVSTPDVSTSTPPGSKGEKKKSKAAQRQPQAEAQEPVSPTTTKEDDSAAGTEDIVSEDGEKKNQYVETLNKRLRALKKKMVSSFFA